MLSPFCKTDPILELLNDCLRASIIRLPDERIYPLNVIEKPRRERAKFRGYLGYISTYPILKSEMLKYLEKKTYDRYFR